MATCTKSPFYPDKICHSFSASKKTKRTKRTSLSTKYYRLVIESRSKQGRQIKVTVKKTYPEQGSPQTDRQGWATKKTSFTCCCSANASPSCASPPGEGAGGLGPPCCPMPWIPANGWPGCSCGGGSPPPNCRLTGSIIIWKKMSPNSE